MDRFDKSMSPDQIEEIREFIIQRATESYDGEVKARDNAEGVPSAQFLNGGAP